MEENPVKKNQVFFWQRGRRRVGWIGQSTPTRYRIDYKLRKNQKGYSHAWRRKTAVEFQLTGKRGRIRRNAPSRPVRKAARLSSQFYGFHPRQVNRILMRWPKALVRLGRVVRLDYVCDKEDGRTRIYRHDFGRPPMLCAGEKNVGGGKNLLLVIGSFRITKEGIVG